MIRIVFMGSPEFAIPILQALVSQYQIVGAVTQPDRKAGRGMVVSEPAIKIAAKDLGLSFIQPQRLTDTKAMAQLREWEPDLIVVAAFGQLLRPELLNLPKHGCVNVHASLLPRWRGAAPIQAAIAAGDTETGVTIMKMDEGMDTGGILKQRSTPIRSDDTGGSLLKRLSELGAALLSETLPIYLTGSLTPHAQDSTQASKAPLLRKSDGELNPAQSAEVLERCVRALNPWPGAYIPWRQGGLKVHRAHVAPGEARPGNRLVFEGMPGLGTAGGLLVLDEVQPAGKKPMEGRAFLLGARDWSTE
jgi:methionyl-tRNA formyltransferase